MKHLTFFYVCCLLIGCSPKDISFSEDQLHTDYFKKIYRLANESDPVAFHTAGTCDTLRERVFLRKLEDRYKMIDGVAMTSIERDDTLRSVDLPVIGTHYKLYLILTNYENGNKAILIPSTYIIDENFEEHCVRLGPAWIGNWGMGYIAFYKQLKWSTKGKSSDTLRWVYKKSLNKVGENNLRASVKEFGPVICLNEVTIKEMFNLAPNGLGGKKPVSFNIAEIFGDNKALQFKRISTSSSH